MLCVFLASIGGGLVQASTGFGFGIIVMLFLPIFLPILKSSALSTLMGATACFSLAWKYRKYATPKVAIMPAIVYFVFSFAAIRFAVGADFGKLKAFFGLFLMAIAVYFIFFSEKIKIRATPLSALICGGISGIASGLFGIGGPPMAIYMLSIAGDDKNKYIANSQLFFSITCIYTTGLRILNGIITPDLLPFLVPGIVGMFIGKGAGSKIVEKIDAKQMKKLIYVFLAFSGFLNFIQNI